MNYLIVLTSVTAAKRVSKMAEEHFAHCSVIHTPSALSKVGCSYCIKTESKYYETVYGIAKKMGMQILGLYKEIKENGKIMYVKVDEK